VAANRGGKDVVGSGFRRHFEGGRGWSAALSHGMKACISYVSVCVGRPAEKAKALVTEGLHILGVSERERSTVL